jgi:hypothetical protein
MKIVRTLVGLPTATIGGLLLTGCGFFASLQTEPAPEDTAAPGGEALVATREGSAVYIAHGDSAPPAMREIADFRMQEYCAAQGQDVTALPGGAGLTDAATPALAYRCD